MATRILVPLRHHGQLEEMTSCIELLAQPGSEVVFLLRLRESWFPWWLEHTVSFHTDLALSSTLQRSEASWTRQKQRTAAEPALRAVRKRLAVLGVSVRLELYSGPLKGTVRRFSTGYSTTVVVMGQTFRYYRRLWGSLRRPIRALRPQRVPLLLVRV